MTLRLIGAGGMDPAMTARIEAVEKAAEKAEATGQNAREMVLKRDPRLISVEGNYEALMALAATVEERTEASETDRAGLHQALEALAMEMAAIQLVPGPQGEAGPAGPTGQAGPQGLRGPSGVDGVQGERGPQGVDGAAGKDGSTGAAGERGVAGPAGDRGPVGATGPQGATGQTGTPGATGPAGPSATANLAVGSRGVTLLALGGNVDVVVPLSRPMPNTDYQVHAAHSAVVDLAMVSLTVKTKTTTAVTINVRASGLALAAGTLMVVVF